MVIHDPALVLQTTKTFSRRLFDHWEWMEEHVIVGGGFFGFSLKPVAYDDGVMGGGPRCAYLSLAVIGMRCKLTSEGNAEMTLGRPPAGDLDGREFIGITPGIPRALPGFTPKEIVQKMHKAVSLGQCEGRFSDLFATVRGAAKSWGMSHRALDIWFERCFRKAWDKSVLGELDAVQVEAATRKLDQQFAGKGAQGELPAPSRPLVSDEKASPPATAALPEPYDEWIGDPPEQRNRDFTQFIWYGERLSFINEQSAAIGCIWQRDSDGGIYPKELAKHMRERFPVRWPVGKDFKMSGLFRSRYESMRTMIECAGGRWRLKRPQT